DAPVDGLVDGALARPDQAWLRVIGAGAEFLRTDLDEVFGDRPVRVQHRSGAVWTLNSAAVAELAFGLSAEERRTGQLWRADSRLRQLMENSSTAQGKSAAEQAVASQLRRVGARLAAWGVTHVTDASPDTDEASLARLRRLLPQHVCSLAEAGDGPRKVIVADHQLPDLDELTAQLAAEHGRQRPVAIHAVSAVGLGLSIAALEQAGVLSGDRIEHAAVCDDSAARRLAELGLIVVTQPGVFARHGARFEADSPPSERAALWRYGGLLRAGVPVVISSDAPYGDLNPWSNIAAAAQRAGGEAVSAETALASMLSEPTDPAGPARALRVGAAADLCLLRAPRGPDLRRTLGRRTLGESGPTPVLATFLQGRLGFQADPAADD
ncbi:MAG: amidohydrolase, partial [Frankiales bacterium]|nr:amidohydrolase [Frankiales bacterium]